MYIKFGLVNEQTTDNIFRATLKIPMLQTAEIYQTQTASSLRIVLIEDLREIREGLTALINGTSGFKCVAAFGSMETALARIEREKPDAILTDLGLPGMSGIGRYRKNAGDVRGRADYRADDLR